MERIELLPYQRIYANKIKRRENVTLKWDTGLILLIMIGFLISRALFFDQTLPFGLAFYVAALKKGKKYMIVGLPVILSVALTIGVVEALYYLAAISIFTIAYLLIKKDLDITLYALISSILQMSILSIDLLNHFILYNFVIYILSAMVCFSMTFVFYQSIPVIVKVHRRMLSREEIVAFAIMIGIILSGFSGIKIGEFSVANILAALAVIAFAFAGGVGVGCSTGLAVGLISNLAHINPLIITTYGIGGMFAGLFNKLGKLGSIAGFLLSYILIYTYIPSLGIHITLYEIAAAALMFTLLPPSFIYTLRDYVDKTVNKHKTLVDYSMRMKKMASERIKDISDIFDGIAEDMGQFIKNGDDSIAKDLATDSINGGLKILFQQFKGVSEILKNLASDMNQEIEFLSDMEDSIKVELDRNGFDVKDVYVLKKGERIEVRIMKKLCYGSRECLKNVIPIVSKCVGKKMILMRDRCAIDEDMRTCCLVLEEDNKYDVVTAVVSTAKEKINGDNFTFFEIPYGKYMMALSDGMGTGERAARESKLALRLIERFSKVGFSKEAAIKCVNSLMALRNIECFSTLDVCLLDRYTGEAEFIKMGSSSTFIKRKEGVDVIRSRQLPLGIINDVDVFSRNSSLRDGDILVMVTDGILDANDFVKREQWLKQLIQEVDGTPQEIAQKISEETLKLMRGNVKDDMTVMVSKVIAI